MVSRSFGRLTDNPHDPRKALRQHADRAAEKLRKQHSFTSAVIVFIRTNPFRTDLPQYPQRVDPWCGAPMTATTSSHQRYKD
ncbi:DinB/UmuC family translesion DNA polymerase [Vreelandella sulfidaeris]